MTKLKLGGQVFDANMNPVANAKIAIIDEDIGATNDVILTKITDSDGKFKGVSKEWNDGNFINTPLGTRQISDTLQLIFQVSKGEKSHQGSFVHVADHLSAPIICPWLDPKVLIAKVNNTPCYTDQEFKSELQKGLSSGKNVTIRIYDPAIQTAFAPMVGNPTSRKAFAENISANIVEGVPVPTPPDIFFVLLGVAIIIVASAALIGVAILGSAVLLAITLGYSQIGFEHETDADGSHLKVDFNN